MVPAPSPKDRTTLSSRPNSYILVCGMALSSGVESRAWASLLRRGVWVREVGGVNRVGPLMPSAQSGDAILSGVNKGVQRVGEGYGDMVSHQAMLPRHTRVGLPRISWPPDLLVGQTSQVLLA